MKLIAITGGIGCGKSVVSTVLKAMGYYVYDTDSRASLLMDEDSAIHARLVAEIHERAVVDGQIDRRLIASVVFSDASKLAALNAIVHANVLADLRNWCVEHSARCDKLFVECAIPYESGLHRMVDEMWEVTAPHAVRVRRVMMRGAGMSEAEVLGRIKAQESTVVTERHAHVSIITNDDVTPVLPQILSKL